MSADINEDSNQYSQEYVAQVNEEAYYYAVLVDFIDMVHRYGEEKVMKDMQELLCKRC